MWWSAVAGLLNQNQADSQAGQAQNVQNEAVGRQQIMQKRQMQTMQPQMELQDMQDRKQQAFQKQQSVLDEIMQKYRIGGM